MKKVFLNLIVILLFSLSANAQRTKANINAITTAINTMQKGWNEKSGEKYASVFADKHDFIVWNGNYFPNTTKTSTAAGLQGLFDGPGRMYDLKLKIDKIKFIRSDIALVHVLGASYEKEKEIPKDPGVLMSLLMEYKNKKWEIISFHNLDLEAFQDDEVKKRLPFPAEVMYASWYKK